LKNNIIIALDGPAGAGKSTIAKIVAQKLGLEYIDSGAFYRAITKIILDSNIKIDDYNKIEELLQKINIKFDNGRIYINDIDLTDSIRGKEVTLNVSPVSSIIAVRKKVNKALNQYANNKSIIMDGRDIGTVVFPNATYKFYLDASVEIRAIRRFKEKTLDMSLEDIKEAIIKRDENDKNKEFGALKIADDAVYIDTSDYSIEQVVSIIIDKIKNI
jgi:cytidylate kinase